MEKYNRLLVLGTWIVKKYGKNRRRAKCQCDCGTIKDYDYSSVKSGKTKSCGCLARELLVKRNYRHGLRKNKFASRYYDMLRRCYDPTHHCYHNYGGRGITVCPEWKNSLKSFIEWAESQPFEDGYQLDRIDNDKGYSPKNCHFVSLVANLSNRRNTIHIGNESLDFACLRIEKETGIPANTIRSRYFKLKKYNLPITEENLRNHIDIRNLRKQANQLPLHS